MARPQVGDLIPLIKKVPYTRPADWLPMPELTSGDQKIVGLHAVWPHDSNFVALKCQGAYKVDWGDGSSPQNYTSGATAYHVFDYDDLEGTECSRGYRQAIVTITPQAGHNLTAVDFVVKHNQSGLTDYYSTGWLDVRAAGENITSLKFGLETLMGLPTTPNTMLEIVEFVGDISLTSFNSMFAGCYSLQSIPQLNTSRGTNFSEMFAGCYSLQSVPQLDTSSGTNFSRMFAGCYSLQSIPQLNTSSGTNFSSMFNGCYSLQSVPQLDTSSGTDFSGMFMACSSLQSVPQLDTSSGTDFSGMFAYCGSLQSVPQLNTSSGTDFSMMFMGCSSLQSVPQLNTSSGTNFSMMFMACYSLSAAPLQGASENISFESCRLSRQALIDIFNGLATVSSATITISGNWGAQYLTTQDRNIATNKGWTIAG